MKKTLMAGFPLLVMVALAEKVNSQSMRIGEIITVSNVALKKDVKPEAFQNYFEKEVVPLWIKNGKGNTIFLFKGDRGNRKGEFLLVYTSNPKANREKLPPGSPFTDKNLSGNNTSSIKISDFLANPGSYTDYDLIGAEKFNPLPMAGILGMHYIKVKKDSAAAFEKFVKEKLNPAVGHLLPDLQLLYYKAIAGENAGTYITIFVLKSGAARDKYWPAGAPETEPLKEAFRPLKGLAKELGTYLVEDSYLKPESGGAAAFFESIEWTDFVTSGF